MDSGMENWLASECCEMFIEIRESKFMFTGQGISSMISEYEPLTLSDFFQVHKDRFLKPRGMRPIEDLPEGADGKFVVYRKIKKQLQFARISVNKEMENVMDDLRDLLARCSMLQLEFSRQQQQSQSDH